MVSPLPSIIEEALFLRGSGILARSIRAHLSGAFGAKNNVYLVHIVSERVTTRSQPAQ